MNQQSNQILLYLSKNRGGSFQKKDKRSLLELFAVAPKELDLILSQLNQKGYINLYYHPLLNNINIAEIDPNQRVFYSISSIGIRFLQKRRVA